MAGRPHPESEDDYYSDDMEEGDIGEEVDHEYNDAMALNAKLKQLLAGGMDDPAVAAQVMALAQAADGAGGGAPREFRGEARGARVARGAPRRVGSGTSGGSRTRRTASGRGGGSAALARKSSRRGGGRGAAGSPQRRNYTFTEDHLNNIGRSNLRLMQNLTSINTGRGVMRTRDKNVKIKSSAAINRQRRSRAIQNDNAAFLKRLQNVKASKALSRTTMKKDADRQRALAAKCRTVKKKKKKRVPSLDDRANGPGMQF